MQQKIIKAILRNKIEGWAKSVEVVDAEVANHIRKNTVVMGGAICSMLTNEKVNDYDVYFRTREACKAVVSFYLKQFAAKAREKERKQEAAGKKPIGTAIWWTEAKDPPGILSHIKSAGVVDVNNEKAYRYFETESQDTIDEFFGTRSENVAAATGMKESAAATVEPSLQVSDFGEVSLDKFIEDAETTTAPEDKSGEKDKNLPRYRPIYVTQNAITLSDDIQIVTRFYGEPDEILQYFDYEHCKIYWTSWEGKLHLTVNALEALMNKRLVYTGSRYPVCSLFRMRKFMARGWSINAGQIVKMAWQIHQLDLSDIEVLQDQLVGVDHAYFVEIISLLQKNSDVQEGKGAVDATYLMQLLDAYF